MAFAIVFKYGQSEDLKDSFEHDLVGALVITILFWIARAWGIVATTSTTRTRSSATVV